MTYKQACRKASTRARKSSGHIFVMREIDPYTDETVYEIATEHELDSWYLGDTPIAAFAPDGLRDD